MDELSAYREAIVAADGSTDAVDRLVDAVANLDEESRVPRLLMDLRAEADRLPWIYDSDYAAVALQMALPRAVSLPVRRAMLGFALDRARWCASCATAGGEGLARSIHVRELEALVAKDEI